MRRRSVHLAFACSAVLCASVAAYEALALRQRLTLNDEIGRINAMRDDERVVTDRTAPAQTKLARANALSRRGAFDLAATAYSDLVRQDVSDRAGQAALLNLGNLYMRQGLSAKDTDDKMTLPMFELAKQRYRDLLKIAPQDWDARYNLERALRLAPEDESAFVSESMEVVERRRVKLRGMSNVQLP